MRIMLIFHKAALDNQPVRSEKKFERHGMKTIIKTKFEKKISFRQSGMH